MVWVGVHRSWVRVRARGGGQGSLGRMCEIHEPPQPPSDALLERSGPDHLPRPWPVPFPLPHRWMALGGIGGQPGH